MKRTPLKRSTPIAQGHGLKRSKRINRKRRDPRRGRLVLVGDDRKQLRLDVWERAGHQCEAGISPECPGRLDADAFEWHHRKLRSQGGNDEHVNSLCLCHACHTWAHQHPAKAREIGLIVPRVSDPASRAVTLADGRIVRLTDDNRYDLVFESPEEASA